MLLYNKMCNILYGLWVKISRILIYGFICFSLPGKKKEEKLVNRIGKKKKKLI